MSPQVSHIIVTLCMRFLTYVSLIFPRNWMIEIRKLHAAAHVSSQQSFVLSLWTYQDAHSSSQCFCLDPKHDERMRLTFCPALNFYVNKSVLRVEGRIGGVQLLIVKHIAKWPPVLCVCVSELWVLLKSHRVASLKLGTGKAIKDERDAVRS